MSSAAEQSPPYPLGVAHMRGEATLAPVARVAAKVMSMRQGASAQQVPV